MEVQIVCTMCFSKFPMGMKHGLGEWSKALVLQRSMVTELCRYLPDLILGDLDSLRPDVRAFYASHGVPVVQDDDQDSTDLMKCIQALKEKERRENSEV